MCNCPNEKKISDHMLSGEERIVWVEGFNPTKYPYVREMIVTSTLHPKRGRPPWPDAPTFHAAPTQMAGCPKPAFTGVDEGSKPEDHPPITFKRLVGWSEMSREFRWKAGDNGEQGDGLYRIFRRAFYLCPQDPRDGDGECASGFLPVGATDDAEFPPDAVATDSIAPGKLGTRPTASRRRRFPTT